MAFVAEGQTQKLEVIRGAAAVTLTYWPRGDGKLLAATSPTAKVFDPSSVQLATPSATVQSDGSIIFSWTPGAALQLAEDYRYEVTFSVGGVVRSDVVYFDLVRMPLSCPVDQNLLEAIEPDLPKWLAGRNITDASRYIARAWDEIVARIRAAGYRPALVTDRFAFVGAGVELALVKVLTSCIRQPGDLWDRKREIHADDYEAAWSAIGAIKFEDELQPGPVEKRTIAQPHFRR